MSSQPPNNSPEEPSTSDESGWRPSRRTFLWTAAGAAAGALLLGRACFYDANEWDGRVLAEWEAAVLAAAATAIIPDSPGALPAPGPSGLEVAANVDRFLEGLPDPMLLEIHGMFALIEHGTLLGGSVRRFTRLDPQSRLEFLVSLRNKGGKLSQAFEGLRDLTLLGWYSDRRTWKPIGYDGPLLERPAPPPVVSKGEAGKYGRLIAAPGQTPKGVL